MIRAAIHAMLLTLLACHGDEVPQCKVAVATLSLPTGSDGLLHWRAGDAATVPLQLSTRYFSEPVKMSVGVIGFYDAPVAEKVPEPPKPLVALTIPPDTRLAFIVLWSAIGAEGREVWKASLLRGSDWKEGSLRVFNSTDERLGILSGEKRIPLSGGKSFDFHSRDWKEAFPVKIFRVQPEMRAVFSSKWRVAPDRRELCFIFRNGDALVLRSLIHLAVPQEEPEG